MPSPYAMLKSNRRPSTATKAPTGLPQKYRLNSHKSIERIATKVSTGSQELSLSNLSPDGSERCAEDLGSECILREGNESHDPLPSALFLLPRL